MANKHDNSDTNSEDSYVLERGGNPLFPSAAGSNEAANVIRKKLDKIYADEPNALQEEQQAEAAHPRSKHQQFMHELNSSGKTLVEIQTAWHNYYAGLPAHEKHEVWQEFYSSAHTSPTQHPSLKLDGAPVPAVQAAPLTDEEKTEKIASIRSHINAHSSKFKKARKDKRDASQVQHDIQEHATKKKIGAKQHAHSLLFGLGFGVVTLIIFSFSFFNEVIIAPFIQPARTAAATPLIVSTDTVAPSDEAQVIIPKINVQIPIRFDVSSTSEDTMQKELEEGVAHYPTTSMPGENGNGAYFGHSSNNIFNKGKYKFAFVLLNQLTIGDTFYITKDGKLFAYKVFEKKVVEPNQVEVLLPVEGHTATATLITCDPPGTSLRRLVVVGDQISPDPNGNIASEENKPLDDRSFELAGNSPTLWGRIIGSGIGKAIIGVLVVGSVVVLFRRLNKQAD